MKTIKLIAIALSFIAITANSAHAQLEKMQAAYIYNFATMSSYPSSMAKSNFVIAVLGNSQVYSELEAISQSKKIGAQGLVIKRINSTSEIGDAHMVFIPDAMKSKFMDVINHTASTPTIVVSESHSFAAKGAVFNFVMVDSKLKFQVNEPKANAKGVKLAANLVKLGITEL